MEEIVKFLKEAETYYLATVEGDQPRVRPFGTAHIFEGKLYIQTGKKKDVSKQLHANPKAELCACGTVPFYKRGPAAIWESNFQEEIPCRAFQGIGCLCRIREIFPGRKRWKAAIAEILEKTERRTDERNRGEEKGICSPERRISTSGNCIG